MMSTVTVLLLCVTGGYALRLYQTAAILAWMVRHAPQPRPYALAPARPVAGE